MSNIKGTQYTWQDWNVNENVCNILPSNSTRESQSSSRIPMTDDCDKSKLCSSIKQNHEITIALVPSFWCPYGCVLVSMRLVEKRPPSTQLSLGSAGWRPFYETVRQSSFPYWSELGRQEGTLVWPIQLCARRVSCSSSVDNRPIWYIFKKFLANDGFFNNRSTKWWCGRCECGADSPINTPWHSNCAYKCIRTGTFCLPAVKCSHRWDSFGGAAVCVRLNADVPHASHRNRDVHALILNRATA